MNDKMDSSMWEDLLFYDWESFKYDALVVFKNIHKEKVAVFHNNFEGLYDVVKDKILVGFNNHNYDDYITGAVLRGYDSVKLNELTNDIIYGCPDHLSKREHMRKFKHLLKPFIKTLDVSQEISADEFIRASLKKVEANMGSKIFESSVPFDLDRPLTKDEFIETYNYCSYDVDKTIDIFLLDIRQSYFQGRLKLVNDLCKSGNFKLEQIYKWNTTTLSANYVVKSKLPQWATLRFPEKVYEVVPREVKEHWKKLEEPNMVNMIKKIGQFKDSDVKIETGITIKDLDCEINFSYGGLHGSNKNRTKFKDVVLLDVNSMHPNIIVLLNVLGQYTISYENMKNERLKVKYTDPVLSTTLKLVLNKIYGLLGEKYSMLYNPMAGYSVCIYSQASLYDLAKRLYNSGFTIIQLNTDGVAFENNGTCDYNKIAKEWEEDWNLGLGEELYDYIFQRDVNSYCGVKDGKITKHKGSLSRYKITSDIYFKDSSKSIVVKCLVDHLVLGKDVVENLYENLNNPILYQIILTSKGNMKVKDEHGNVYNKVNRVFAVKKSTDSVYLQKYGVRYIKDKMYDSPVIFNLAPDNMWVFNDDIKNIDINEFSKRIDLNYYYKEVMKELEKWV